MSLIKSEDPVAYGAEKWEPPAVTPNDPIVEDAIIEDALVILRSRLRQPGETMDGGTAARKFVALKLGQLEHEVFAVLFLDNRNCIIEHEEMFRGTIDQAAVHPREIAKRALALNAKAVILAHNHPSGEATPSHADKRLTKLVTDALGLLDIRVLDHIVVGGADTASMAEMGMM